MRRPLASFVALAIPAACLLESAESHAYEHQWHVGGGAGYSLLIQDGKSLHGFGGALHLTYGLNDTFNLMAQIDTSYHPAGQLVLTGGSVGVGYVIDVLRWVPYAGVMVGGAGVFATGPCGGVKEVACASGRLSLSAPLGLDYQISRSFAVGAAARIGMLLFGPEPANLNVTGMLRAEYIWGF